MDVVDLPLEQIIPYARNPRKNDAAVATVAASLAEFGWRHTSRGALRGTCYAQPMFGLFNLFGRAPELKAMDHALREAGLHPQTVPEAVKLTAVRLLKETNAGATLSDAAYAEAAQLLGFCMLGRDQFIASNSVRAAERAEDRLESAIAAGDSLDAELVLLAFHSGVIVSEVADRFDVESG